MLGIVFSLFFCMFFCLVAVPGVSVSPNQGNSSFGMTRSIVSSEDLNIDGTSMSSLHSSSSSSNELMRIPLIPYHVQKRRVRRQLSEEFKVSEDSGNQEEEEEIRDDNEKLVSALQVGALYQGYGTHYADLWCGTPPQRQTVIVDTGSSVTAFPCHGCKQCGEKVYHIDNLFLQDESSTFTKVPCDECIRGRCSLPKGSKYNDCKIGMSYQEGSSWTAFEAKDVCYVAGPHNVPLSVEHHHHHHDDDDDDDDGGDDNGNGEEVRDDLDPSTASSLAFELVFGCQTKLTGLFKTQLADGIMGMDNAHEAFWKQMHEAGKMKDEIFTLCFARSPHVDRAGTEAGALTLGGIDTRLHKTTMIFTKDNTSSGFYAVNIRKVYLREPGGGDSVRSTNPDLKISKVDVTEADLAVGRTIIDSGTTDTYFSKKIATAFKRLWKQVAKKDYSQIPVSLTPEQLDSYPTIIIQFAGHTRLNPIIAHEDPESVAGLAGALDPDNPYDVLLAVPPRHYMEFDEDNGKYVNRFYLDESRGTVIGANAMMGHDVVFDVRSNRLGWAESDCDYTNLITQYGYDSQQFASLPETNNKQQLAETEPEAEAETQAESESETEAEQTTPHAFEKPPVQQTKKDKGSFSLMIQVGIFAAVMFIAIIIAYRYRRAAREAQKISTAENAAQLSELELQQGYRDDPIDEDDESDDDDEMPSTRRNIS